MNLENRDDVQRALNYLGMQSSEANKELVFKCIERAQWLKDEDLEFLARRYHLIQLTF